MPRILSLTSSANGSSLPWFGQLDDGGEYLIKFAGAGPGASALLAEYLANEFGRLWGFPTPRCTPAVLDQPDLRVGNDEFWDVLARSQGWNLAIERIPGATNIDPALAEGLDHASLIAFDARLINWDRTTLSRNLLQDQAGKIHWIDHGSCRFLHALTQPPKMWVPSNHFLADSKIAAASLAALESSDIEAIVARAPVAWLLESGWTESRLTRALIKYLA